MANPLWKGSQVITAVAKYLLGDDVPSANVPSDWVAHGVSIDTRDLKPGDIFVALPGERVDGHDYVEAAFEAGAAAAFVRQDFTSDKLPASAVLLPVSDVLGALEALGRAARQRSQAHIMAVTGSVGKTSVKETLAAALSKSGTVHASERSFNNHIGVPLSLARLPEAKDFAVFELGMNHAGELTDLVDMVRPQCAIITTIGTAHIENFDDMTALAQAKAEILSGVVAGGVAILPRDNEHYNVLQQAAGETRMIDFSAEGNTQAQAFTAQVKLHDTCSCVTAHILGQEVIYKIGTPGAHHVANSLAVLAAVQNAGADLALAALSLGDNEGLSGRGRRYRIGEAEANMTLIDESYNANPTSMAAALKVLGLAPRLGRGRRIAVLGDMAELGQEAPALHAGLAENIEQADIDLVLTCGDLMKHLHTHLPPGRMGPHVNTSDEIMAILHRELRANDVVMVKGSHSSGMEKVVDALLATSAAEMKKARVG
ncbi:MAG: UDP-N-acetylmuramoyl-tripeptide--D-alanyl-D-alanine ligase [Rhodobiaceae bacterium]|jgi:UDP-N-acetylmuramoyl-tripeptide--D-alanyl-D-alanine ligase|nr:UDP-N-acetylmuramoyl-tripeptide--D-alanyl-D-alanine ligase [Rhodobiaceae bacterium]MBT5517705.1 UDP-N-acetylmuramoyl-tripeptide--D-alanyl-D-alanine ligase [Rhodobiaceae bacterium]MBT7279772.1 UDP-N-acetylmuramoyl-tripeptide--D-alanyl-D-alanine ligase [Rhodobiaceae bacterium]MDG2495257.1 UDP-N-acetylmuramoyl-tripeptide--D-alanyl-D-alanine ligase [Alphaproteobacteria bacterium]